MHAREQHRTACIEPGPGQLAAAALGEADQISPAQTGVFIDHDEIDQRQAAFFGLRRFQPAATLDCALCFRAVLQIEQLGQALEMIESRRHLHDCPAMANRQDVNRCLRVVVAKNSCEMMGNAACSAVKIINLSRNGVGHEWLFAKAYWIVA